MDGRDQIMRRELASIGFVAALLLGGAGGCDRSGASRAEKGGGPQGDPSDPSIMQRERPRERRTAMRERAAARGAQPRATQGPTGIQECDEALDIVCRCAEKNASLIQPCKTLKADATRWKAQARSEDPATLDATRQACRRILEGIQKAYGCKP